MKRVVGALNPKLDGFEASCFDGRLHHRRRQSRPTSTPCAAQRARRRRRRRSALAPGAAAARSRRAHADRATASQTQKLPRTRLPPTRGSTRWRVREGLPPSQWGENSEALFLTSSFVQPDAATAAARFANEEEAFIYSALHQPDA